MVRTCDPVFFETSLCHYFGHSIKQWIFSFTAVRLQEATQALAYSLNVAEIQSYVTEMDGFLQSDDPGKVHWLALLELELSKKKNQTKEREITTSSVQRKTSLHSWKKSNHCSCCLLTNQTDQKINMNSLKVALYEEMSIQLL